MNFDLNSGVRLCRADVDWQSIEPQDGVFDEAAIARCRQELQSLADRGLRPLLVLHSFANPRWLDERGAFTRRDSVTCFLRFVHKVVESVGDLAGEYVTFSEPNLYAWRSYLGRALPPGKRSLLDMARAMTNLSAAHIEAYGLIRKTRLKMGFTDTRVGTALHLRSFVSLDPADPVQRFRASQTRQLFQGGITRAMCTGRVSFPIGRHPSIVPGQYCDFYAPGGWSRSVLGGPVPQAGREDGDLPELCRELCCLLPRPVLLAAGEPELPEDIPAERYWDAPPAEQ